jgi:hypothetical protein
MASAFPSLTPNTRTYTPGTIPSTPYKSLSGAEVTILHGSQYVDHSLTVSFNPVLQSIGNEVLEHFIEVGTHTTFTLPSTIFAGLTAPSLLNPSANVWRYKDSPKFTYLNNGYQAVTVDFVSRPA